MLIFQFSIIGISESWLNNVKKHRYSIKGYNSEHLCRKNKGGGGVSIFIKDDIKYKRRKDLDLMTDFAEAIFIQIDKDIFNTKKDILIATIYRPPNTDLNKFTKKIKDWISPIKNKFDVYYLGDYNVNLLSYSIHNPTSKLIDILYANGFVPLINEPTRITSQSLTLIDNIYTNCTSETERGIFYTDISDHFPIFCMIKYA